MPDKVNYSLVENESGNIAVQSTVASFGLNHVTEKDIIEFYSAFSQYAAFDSGLLPVEGSGMLSIRQAGEFSQFAYQHQPGLYHVNWAAHEGGTASAYYVAQPYRIIICDIHNGNLLGARMFYSPYPITTPSQPLYHVNLPNINCKGYRKNGVGWICLYQNEDWSNLPYNERVVRFIERCSGVETYNDANMSETDGTRFYRENKKPEYLWNPVLWQEKSSQEGYLWTLDESLWIPVLVQDMDTQDKHYSNGQPLTFADALVGDYRAHYYDETSTKPINAVIRPDKNLSDKTIMSYFIKSYTAAAQKSLLNNTFASSQTAKSQIGSSIFKGSSLLNSPEDHTAQNDDEDTFCCDCCNEEYSSEPMSDHYSNAICEGCFNDYYVYIESTETHFHQDDDNLIFSNYDHTFYHSDYDTIYSCESCGEYHCASYQSSDVSSIYEHHNGNYYCKECFYDILKESDETYVHCSSCNNILFPNVFPESVSFPSVAIPIVTEDNSDDALEQAPFTQQYLCNNCSPKVNICPCGFSQSEPLVPVTYIADDSTQSISSFLKENNCSLTSACVKCTKIDIDNNGDLYNVFQPVFVNKVNEHFGFLDETNSSPQTHPFLTKKIDISDIF